MVLETGNIDKLSLRYYNGISGTAGIFSAMFGPTLLKYSLNPLAIFLFSVMPQSQYAESLHERGRMAKLRNLRSFLLAGTRI